MKTSYSRMVYWSLGSIALFILAYLLYVTAVNVSLVRPSWITIIAAVFLGIVAADFVSGMVHWACDTWGRADIPILGTIVLKSFRLHHVDQLGITRHDFFEANILNFIVSIPVMFGAFKMELSSELRAFVAMFLSFLVVFVVLTNQIHKWAHQARRSKLVSWLQKHHEILSAKAHAIHHSRPYTHAYCITTGWLNGPLEKIKFFRALERVITALTGAVPRSDEARFEKLYA